MNEAPTGNAADRGRLIIISPIRCCCDGNGLSKRDFYLHPLAFFVGLSNICYRESR